MAVQVKDCANVVDVRPCLLTFGIEVPCQLVKIKDQFVLVLVSLLHVIIVCYLSKNWIVFDELVQSHCILWSHKVNKRPQYVSNFGCTKTKRNVLVFFKNALHDLHLVRINTVIILIPAKHRNNIQNGDLFLQVLVGVVNEPHWLQQVKPLLHLVDLCRPLDVLDRS